MSDYRNPDHDYHNPEDPFRRDAKFDPDVGAANVMWGWIAAAVFIVAILAVASAWDTSRAEPTPSNDVTPPMINHSVPPATVPPPADPGAGDAAAACRHGAIRRRAPAGTRSKPAALVEYPETKSGPGLPPGPFHSQPDRP